MLVLDSPRKQTGLMMMKIDELLLRIMMTIARNIMMMMTMKIMMMTTIPIVTRLVGKVTDVSDVHERKASWPSDRGVSVNTGNDDINDDTY